MYASLLRVQITKIYLSFYAHQSCLLYMWAVYLIQSVTESCHACTLLAHTCHTHIYINAVTVQIGENTAPQIGLSDYTLTCSISGIVDRNATYRWIKDSSTQIWNSTGTNSSILSFASPLKLSNAGNYTCEVSIARESPSLASSVMATIEASWAVTIESKSIASNALHSCI